MRELVAYWSSLRAKLSPEDEAAFRQEYRRRSFGISLIVLLLAAAAGTILVLLQPGPVAPRDLAIRLSLAWAAPVCLLFSRKWSERWYPWVISVTVSASLSYYLLQGLYQTVVNDNSAVDAQLFQFQMRTAIVTFFVTALLQLPVGFAAALAIGNYLIFAAIQTAAPHPDTPFVLVRIGLLVGLGIFVSWVVEARERLLFGTRAKAERRLQQYLDAQEAAADEIKRVEALSNVERQRRLQFIRDMLHDMRNTVGAIGSNIENYQTAIAKNLPQLADQAANQVFRSYKVTNALCEDLFDLSSYQQGRGAVSLESVDVGELTKDVVASLRHKAKRKGFDIAESAPRHRTLLCKSNRGGLQRILINLLSNAIKFTPCPSGKKCAVIMRAVQNGNYIDIHVYDRGVGIAPERSNEIWEYGKTTPGTQKEPGHGIGLTLVRAIVLSLQEHSVKTQSVQGKGSRFTVRVPVCDEAQFTAAPSTQLVGTTIEGLNVLVIDDEEVTLDSHKLTVTLCGAIPLSADSLAAAEAVLSGHTTPPALILADFHLRNGEKGTDAIRALRTHYSSVIPAIVITSDSSPDPGEAIRDMERVSLLQKPLKSRLLAEEVNRLLACADVTSTVES